MGETILQPADAVIVPMKVNDRETSGSAFSIQAYVDRFPGRVWITARPWPNRMTLKDCQIFAARQSDGCVQVRILRDPLKADLFELAPKESELRWHDYEHASGELVYAR